jgi:hypothetical protein
MNRALAIVLLCGCASGVITPYIACMSDSQCGGGLVCFADGCGDPGTGIVVEVTGGTSTGLFPQDFALGDAGVTAAMTFEIAGPIGIEGQMNEGAVSTGNLVTYTDQVTIRARGESTLIPGLVRNYEVSFPSLTPTMGFYKMFLGAGHYDVTAFPVMGSTYPPQVAAGVEVTTPAGADYTLPVAGFTFPSQDQCLYVNGTLVEVRRQGQPDKLADSPMQLQAFDTLTHRPLSQPTQVSTVDGQFLFYVDPSARGTISLIATPRDNTALAPTKTFVVNVPTGTKSIPGLSLELGDYGKGLPQVPGVLVGSDGGPIAGATVVVSGTVGGGGTFNSQSTTSGTDGGFALNLLPSQSNSSFVLTAYPPSDSPSGIVQIAVGTALVGTTGTLTSGPITAPDRLIVSGRLLRPDGQTPLDGATVVATPTQTLDGHPLPLVPSQTLTDLTGRYQLSLDPAVYRFDYVPGEQLPLKSRVVRVESAVDVDAGSFVNTIDLGDFALSTGRTVMGSVAVRAPTDPAGSGKPAANALVRYFRVTSVEGQPSSLLIGQAITDGTGSYQLILPNHPSATVSVDAGQLDGG